MFYWLVVVATTTVGTTTSDMLDRTLGLGYVKSSVMELLLVLPVLYIWRRSTGSIAVDRITTRKNEIFFWLTILVSNTLGTALGDMEADSAGVGFERGALLFAGLILVVVLLHYFTRVLSAVLFWAAYVLTRPLGATLGDTLTKPAAKGGAELRAHHLLARHRGWHDHPDRRDGAAETVERRSAGSTLMSRFRFRCTLARPLDDHRTRAFIR